MTRIANADAVAPEVGSTVTCPYCRKFQRYDPSQDQIPEMSGTTQCGYCASAFVILRGGATRPIHLAEVERLRKMFMNGPESARAECVDRIMARQHRCGVWG